jgi:hypothetical protein
MIPLHCGSPTHAGVDRIPTAALHPETDAHSTADPNRDEVPTRERSSSRSVRSGRGSLAGSVRAPPTGRLVWPHVTPRYPHCSDRSLRRTSTSHLRACRATWHPPPNSSFDRSVWIRPLWLQSPWFANRRTRARNWFFCMIRSTRFRPTPMPRARSLARTLRYPSPWKGLSRRTFRIRTRTSSSLHGLRGPRLTKSTGFSVVDGPAVTYHVDRDSRYMAQIIVRGYHRPVATLLIPATS